MNRLYPNSRRESIKENKYLNTLPAGEDGGRSGLTRTKLKHVTRAGMEERKEGGQNAWDEKWMETARQNLQPKQLLKSKQERAYSLIPFLM
ncbi:hypothetical protein TNCV_3472511 [Trichonephila clavipes]|nr:hypothetical protein TNCV_3472511 [Trichonephila clavipes]